MHEVGIIILFESLLLHVAFKTVFSGNGTISHNGVAVTFVAGVPVVEYERMVIPGCFFGSEFCFVMALRAFVDLGMRVTLLKMADEAGAFGDSDVLPLDDLRMTACALKFFSSF